MRYPTVRSYPHRSAPRSGGKWQLAAVTLGLTTQWQEGPPWRIAGRRRRR